MATLSPRETQVLTLVAEGHSCKAVARRLSLSLSAVRAYTQSARRKLQAESLTRAVVLAVRSGTIYPN